MEFLVLLTLFWGEKHCLGNLWPDGEVEGPSILIVFSDGAALAFGVVAYIRWKLKGKFILENSNLPSYSISSVECDLMSCIAK